ncbi:enoyl-CoA hydratase/isomerase family protein [uncultured Sphingomonas sp.]|uniref:enoyl-CoA hydratase/isomerase family protein n=1 Tax=uncultured Sphingomonas sp. TaxID=158754 RepID=UPI0035CC3058
MEYETLKIVSEGDVDWLTLNRPDRLNAVNNQMTMELWKYFSGLQNDYSRRIVVLRGAGRAFCAGLDLMKGTVESGGGGEGEPQASLLEVVLRMRSCPQPIIALIHGAACGGGFSFALASDIRIAGRSARMNVAFVKLGLSGCELGTSFFLPRTVGLSVASELMMTGRFIGADRALATGLVSDVTDDDALEAAAQALIDEMRRTSPMGLRKTKETLNNAGLVNDVESVMKLEEHTQMLCMASSNFGEAMSAFNEKRTPVFVS